ncbi:hypothetical protein Tco_0458167 [Tanacetum coccineum]
MTNKINTVLKAIIDQIAGTLLSDTVENPKLSTSSVLSARSYPTKEPQCSTHIHGLINIITIHPKQQNNSRDSMSEEEEQEREGDPEDTNTIAYIKEQRDTPLLERKYITAVGNLGSNRDDEGIEWLDVEEPLDLVDTSEESVINSLLMHILIVGIKRLLDDLRVTADKLMLLAYKLLLSVFRVNAAITKLQLLKR